MKLPYKVLVNAEAFGFGPTAAIADFFPHLRQQFHHVAYIGCGHTLDLQRPFAYDALYEMANNHDARFDEIASQYDLFLTALDFTMGKRAESLGLPTVIYDPLTWYWPKIPQLRSPKTLYIAQAFHGVQERLNQEKLPQWLMVPPIVPKTVPQKERSYILANLGGVQNPLWSFETTLLYAQTMIEIIKQIIPCHDTLKIITSAKIAHHLHDPHVVTYSREEVINFLPRVKLAMMTPGLANIYDSAIYNIPTLFLPPANDSQGQQLNLIRNHKTVDQWVDWSDLFPHTPLDYQDNQEDVLLQIQNFITTFPKERFLKICQQAITALSPLTSSATNQLINRFGCGGAEEVVQATVNFCLASKS